VLAITISRAAMGKFSFVKFIVITEFVDLKLIAALFKLKDGQKALPRSKLAILRPRLQLHEDV